MSWLQPTPFEKDLVAETRQDWPAIIPLARLLSLATRVEPRLLRNARLEFIPGSTTEIEWRLWFSPLVGARSSKEIILHLGAARLLADELRSDPLLFKQVHKFTCDHTRHWSPEDRLEQDLRLDALLDDQDAVLKGLQDMLKRIHDEGDEERRIWLARWSRRSLATAVGSVNALPEAWQLTQYANCSLGASSGLSTGNTAAPAMLPNWLASKLPEPFEPARLAVSVHWDDITQQKVLHCRTAEADEPAIDLPTPLPANLHVQCADALSGTWHVVGADTRVLLPRAAQRVLLRVLLTTIDGRSYDLQAELPEDIKPSPPASTTPLYLSHLAADRKQARRIADWLAKQGIALQLIEEESVDTTAAAAEEDQSEPVRLLRLWTHAAQHRRADEAGSTALPGARAALLRTEALDAPPPGHGAERLLDLRDWQQPEQSEEARKFLEQLRAWLEDEHAPPEPAPLGESAIEAEALLAELADAKTPPPRRLEIGDRLAEIGDPRRGVGVREFVRRFVKPPAESPPAEVDELLDELKRVETIPPRRLAIGNRLAAIGDPRPGVGLDDRGLPALDWVEIPGGEFVFRHRGRQTLPTFFMARYPVTNVQYQTFIDAGGYLDERWWQDIGRPEPDKSPWSQANQPRTDVDWYEAVAFARWLSAQLGYEVRLPTEEEWQRAAYGREDRAYPWGKHYTAGYANVNERRDGAEGWNLWQVTAVGAYPQDASPEGVRDLAGNIMEWCLNKHHTEWNPAGDAGWNTTPDASGDDRMTCGGNYLSSPSPRSYEGWSYPQSRNAYIGFRLTSSCPGDVAPKL